MTKEIQESHEIQVEILRFLCLMAISDIFLIEVLVKFLNFSRITSGKLRLSFFFFLQSTKMVQSLRHTNHWRLQSLTLKT